VNRRNFLGLLGGGAAAVAATRVFPFRVYSLPSEIVTPTVEELSWYGNIDAIIAQAAAALSYRAGISVDMMCKQAWLNEPAGITWLQ
jgi:hypothetical protein